MRDFFLGPLLSLFSLKFYRRLHTLPKGLGFLYPAYLSFWVALLALIMFRLQFQPLAEDFVGWLSQNLPTLKVTQEGIVMDLQAPRLLTHPQWGPLFYLDPLNDLPKMEDLDKALFVVTKTSIAYQDPGSGERRIRQLPKGKQRANWRDATITGETLSRFWRASKPFVSSIFFVILFVGIYFWKLAAGFFYSLLGLIINLFRMERLSYGAVLHVSFFALTPVTLLQVWLGTFPLGWFPLNFFTAALITSLYLALAILGTQAGADRNSV